MRILFFILSTLIVVPMAAGKNPPAKIITKIQCAGFDKMFPPTVELDEQSIKVSGAEVEKTKQALSTNLNVYGRCYEQFLTRSPSARGDLDLTMTVGADTKIATATLNTTNLIDKPFLLCVRNRTLNLKLAKPSGSKPASVHMRLVFTPAGQFKAPRG